MVIVPRLVLCLVGAVLAGTRMWHLVILGERNLLIASGGLSGHWQATRLLCKAVAE